MRFNMKFNMTCAGRVQCDRYCEGCEVCAGFPETTHLKDDGWYAWGPWGGCAGYIDAGPFPCAKLASERYSTCRPPIDHLYLFGYYFDWQEDRDPFTVLAIVKAKSPIEAAAKYEADHNRGCAMGEINLVDGAVWEARQVPIIP